MLRPRPTPVFSATKELPSCQKGSKTFFRSISSMPTPLSSTVVVARPSSTVAWQITVPPRWVYLMALETPLISAWRVSRRSAKAGQGAALRSSRVMSF